MINYCDFYPGAYSHNNVMWTCPLCEPGYYQLPFDDPTFS